ncbi:hypothetical protein FDP41_012392 [Naegleria fowleri]|uniref:JmjC domain-containing protein n=1 Tax=Naegleria fowleri TaxID=5763 RepID=A0A6A5C8L4_NAEFO|nr:uncharacterized protein FDP41_012392 [Naegleria fowleri]KAF0981735.1 hypothetical protein FDP41_012392 [Naegleria fowleri]
MSESVKLHHQLDLLSEQTRELYCGGSELEEAEIEELNGFPCYDDEDEILNFIQHYVSFNKPVVFRNAVCDWPAFDKWNVNYFKQVIGEREISVACTPNGKADAVHDGKFIKPMELKMSFSQFIRLLQNKRRLLKEDISPEEAKEEDVNGMNSMNTIFYAQHQNSSLTKEYPFLMEDVPEYLGFAVRAFNNLPDAVNLWIGDSQSTSSLHKDPYENIYCVIAGKKIFTLYPPTDVVNVPYKNYQEAHYKFDFEKKEWKIEDEATTVPWIDIDPDKESREEMEKKYPRYKYATPLKVEIGPGDALYLPSLWLHQVAQEHNEEGVVIAVNYWHDMQYGPLFNFNQFLCNLHRENLL